MARSWKYGIISRRAINAFLDRERDDHSRFMRLSDAALDIRMREDLEVKPPTWYQLTRKQRAMVLLGAMHKRFAFFADTGTGKTYAAISIMQYLMKTDEARTWLVLVPNLSNKYEWKEQFEKHAPRMRYEVLEDETSSKWEQLENRQSDIYIETYAGLMHLLCKKREDGRKGKAGKNRMQPNETRVSKLQKLIEGVVCDESTFAKEHDALPYRLCARLSRTARAFFVMTGTPFGRDPLDLWSQMMLVDQGESLGETLGLFRQSFFIGTDDYWGGRKWTFDKDKSNLLYEFLAHRSITVEADLEDKPEVSRARRYVDLPKDAVEYYEQAKVQIKASKGDYREMKNAFLRARQISSGFVGYRDDETGDKAQFVFAEQPKLRRLEDFILGNIDPKHKFIVFHEFKVSGRLISAMLTMRGINHRILNGETKDHEGVKRDFNSDPNVQGLLLNNSAGGYGLNLQIAKYGIYYEAPVSAIIRRQTEARFYRQFSKHAWVYIVDLVTRGTADETILGYHAEGKALWRSILNIGEEA